MGGGAARPPLVLVGSTNSVKVRAVAAAVRRLFPPASGAAGTALAPRVVGTPSASGVPDQPWGDEETLQGALNRVRWLEERHCGGGVVETVAPASSSSSSSSSGAGGSEDGGTQQIGGRPWLLVAVEGGVLWRPAPQGEKELYCMAWVAAKCPGSGAVSRARSAEFLLPPALARLVEGGLELGDADDQVFGRVKSGQGTGTIGKLTHGLVTRQDYYTHAVEMALVPFLNPELYPQFAA